jgi:hypothetical protein
MNRWRIIGAFMLGLTLFWGALMLREQLKPETLFPIWYGAHQLAAGVSPYGPAATRDLLDAWQPVLVGDEAAGNGYPLPFLIFWSFFRFFPQSLALALMLAGATLLIAFATLSLWPADRLGLIFLSPMLFQAAGTGNITYLYFGLLLWMLLAASRQNWWLVATLVPILVLKPQFGALFGLGGAWLLWRERQWKPLLLASTILGVLGLISWVIFPGWIPAWRAQLDTYVATQAGLNSMFPWGLFMLVAAWKRPWWVWAALLSVALFPFSGWYGACLLMLYWLDRGGKSALIGVGLGWLHVVAPVFGWTIYPIGIGLLGCWDIYTRARSLPRQPATESD